MTFDARTSYFAHPATAVASLRSSWGRARVADVQLSLFFLTLPRFGLNFNRSTAISGAKGVTPSRLGAPASTDVDPDGGSDWGAMEGDG